MILAPTGVEVCLNNNVPENRAHLNYVPKVPKMGHKLGTKSAPPQSLP